jgi:hypothetical protein
LGAGVLGEQILFLVWFVHGDYTWRIHSWRKLQQDEMLNFWPRMVQFCQDDYPSRKVSERNERSESAFTSRDN